MFFSPSVREALRSGQPVGPPAQDGGDRLCPLLCAGLDVCSGLVGVCRPKCFLENRRDH